MFIGHFSVGLGAKAMAPTISLGTLFLVAQWLDLLWPMLLLMGLEQVAIVPGITKAVPLDFSHYPLSHSLLAVCLWGLLFAGIYRLLRKSTRTAAVVGLGVVSHWVLDLIVHRPDLPLYPGNSRFVGFGLWNYPTAALVLEMLLFVVGLHYYRRATHAKNKSGRYGLRAMAAFLFLIYLGNLFGPPPPNAAAIAWTGLLQWLFIPWAYWIDRNRFTRFTTVAT